jgi:hypothetical protein
MTRPLLRCAALVAIFFSSSCESSCCGAPPPYSEQYCRVPYVVGWPHRQAHDAIVGARLVPRCSNEADYDENGNPYIVYSQHPSGGTLRCGDVVDLVFNAEYKDVIRTTGSPQPRR